MEEKERNISPPPKVLAMYRAVTGLIGEGYDVNKIKVSDITERAGIGKGTAYEYFTSKEEIIANAVAYGVKEKYHYFTGIIQGDGSFSEKFHKMLDYLAESLGEKETFWLMLRVGTGSYEISEAMRREYEKLNVSIESENVADGVSTFMEQGIREGVITDGNCIRQRMAFIAQMLGFAMFLVGKEKGQKIPVMVEQAKEYTYECLVKSLS